MITFTKQPMPTLEVPSGKISGGNIAKSNPPINIGMDNQQFQNQVVNLVAAKVPFEKASKAIDAHTDITDKPKAKQMAEGIYKIMGMNTVVANAKKQIAENNDFEKSQSMAQLNAVKKEMIQGGKGDLLPSQNTSKKSPKMVK